jgi:hypothetical protein
VFRKKYQLRLEQLTFPLLFSFHRFAPPALVATFNSGNPAIRIIPK